MDSTQTAPTVKQKKGIKKLWAKIKASMKSESSISQPPATTATNTPAPNTAGKVATEPTAQPESTGIQTSKPDPVAKPTAQPESAPMPSPEASTEPSTLTAAAPAETSEQHGAEAAKTTQHDLVTKPRAAESLKCLSSISDVIEVDENEDEDEAYVNSTIRSYSPNFSSIQLPQRYLQAVSASDKTRFERAQAIFQKYNLTLEPADWHSPSKLNVERVHKRKRQRVHWSCHECKSTFGKEKICPQCSHVRCSTCVRYPPKKKGEKAQQRTKKLEPVVSSEVADVPTTGACHECKTEFSIGAPACTNCDHQICERCLKETIIASPATSPPGARNIAVAAAVA
ncbi:hypothetical protein PMZ80_009325 [Knufia obscura]|uniref:Uncharacterized protein n=1 Tax=Knufia obscura TaxID=1635080 RepID=A0ABR0RCI9_9EURO|nr:hypothetical protein PMZ80_009325 [Knufia obscura]